MPDVSHGPLPTSDCYSPDYFAMKFFAREYADFNFYLGAGMALEGLIETVHDDIEAEITKACLTSLEKHNEEKRIFLIESKNTVVDYLSSHIGETPTQKEMAEQTGIGLTRLRAILAELKDAGLLVMENRVIVSIDVDMAKEDIEVQVS